MWNSSVCSINVPFGNCTTSTGFFLLQNKRRCKTEEMQGFPVGQGPRGLEGSWAQWSMRIPPGSNAKILLLQLSMVTIPSGQPSGKVASPELQPNECP
jgi:hypothetical protein